MDPAELADVCALGKVACPAVAHTDVTGDQLEMVGARALRDCCANIGDVEHCRMNMRMGDEGAGLAPPLDQTCAHQSGQRLADRGPGAAIFAYKLMLERDAKAGFPCA